MGPREETIRATNPIVERMRTHCVSLVLALIAVMGVSMKGMKEAATAQCKRGEQGGGDQNQSCKFSHRVLLDRCYWWFDAQKE